MAEEQGAPKLHIDSDWKAEAQREKERLTAKEKQRPQSSTKSPGSAGSAAGAPGSLSGSRPRGGADIDAAEHGELPEASFRSLVSMLASQAIMGLGAMADRESGRVIIDLEGARFSIDLLDVLEQKTKGNLTDEEGKELRQLLAELRNRFVQISQMVAKQMASQGAAGITAASGMHGIPGAPGHPGAGHPGAGVAGRINPSAGH